MMVWTPEHISDICEFFQRCAERATSGDGSYEDVLLTKLMRVFWNERLTGDFAHRINKRDGKCRVA